MDESFAYKRERDVDIYNQKQTFRATERVMFSKLREPTNPIIRNNDLIYLYIVCLLYTSDAADE